MGKIILEGLHFFARHGFYEFEEKTGGEFIVDLEVQLEFRDQVQEDRIDGTVNYERLYTIVEEQMKLRSKLLENIAFRIQNQIKNTFPIIQSVRVKIRKLTPPIQGRIDSVGVEID